MSKCLRCEKYINLTDHGNYNVWYVPKSDWGRPDVTVSDNYSRGGLYCRDCNLFIKDTYEIWKFSRPGSGLLYFGGLNAIDLIKKLDGKK